MKKLLLRTAAILVAAVLFIPQANALSAEKAIVLDAATGRVLYEKNADDKSLIASTTKIMTALLICQRCNVLDRVRIPQEASTVFDRYNALQKQQGYDLSQYAGKTVMRYVYQIHNFPNATDPVYATVLVYQGKIIGGDVTDTSAQGTIRGFEMPSA